MDRLKVLTYLDILYHLKMTVIYFAFKDPSGLLGVGCYWLPNSNRACGRMQKYVVSQFQYQFCIQICTGYFWGTSGGWLSLAAGFDQDTIGWMVEFYCLTAKMCCESVSNHLTTSKQ